jgi:hypothetical protein
MARVLAIGVEQFEEVGNPHFSCCMGVFPESAFAVLFYLFEFVIYFAVIFMLYCVANWGEAGCWANLTDEG